MTTDRFTQCPHCQARFKVSSEQLAIAAGRVRCGACLNIFDAIAYSVAQPESSKPSDGLDRIFEEASVETPVDLEDALLEQDGSFELDDEELAIFQDDPEEDVKESRYSGGANANLADEFSTSFLELDQAASKGAHHPDPFITSAKIVEEAPADESWTKDILEDVSISGNKRIEPHISAGSNPDKQSPPLSISPKLSVSTKVSSAQRVSTTAPDSPFGGVDGAQPRGQQEHREALTFTDEQESLPRSRQWFLTAFFVLLNILLLVALMAQASWFHYEKLAKYPRLASLYEQACLLLKCELPVLSDITKIASTNLIVRSHPTMRKALIIDITIINNADYEQPFPNIALYFSDIDKKPIAQRLIHSEEYLTGELLKWQSMPAKQPIQISLEIMDPGKEAVNYVLDFFPVQEQVELIQLGSSDRSNVNQ